MAGVTQGSSQFVASRRAAPGLTRELAELVRMFQTLVADSYRPELHYMRGPGPKWHAKHDPAPAAAALSFRLRPDARKRLNGLTDGHPSAAARPIAGPIGFAFDGGPPLAAFGSIPCLSPINFAVPSSTIIRTSPSRWPTGPSLRTRSMSPSSTARSAAPKRLRGRCRASPIIVLTRERTAFPRAVIEALPDVRLIVSTGERNFMLDVEAARERGIVVCGTPVIGRPTVTIAISLMLELTRHVGYESERLKAGGFWQSTIGPDIDGKTLGIIGLGKLGIRVAKIAKAMGMKVIAWSQNLTPERCREAEVDYAGSKEDLLKQSDIVTLHLVLGPRTRGIIGAKEFALMKPTAYLVNTSRGSVDRRGCHARRAPQQADRRRRPRRLRRGAAAG